MQEEVENRAVTLVISATKLTGRLLKAAILKYLASRKEKRLQKARAAPEKPTGKQTVKQLIGQNQGVSTIEITDSNIKSFERVARKYGVDFAVKKDRSVSPPKYLIFFKGRDADALTAAFREYTAKEVKRASQDKPSVLEQLRALKAKVLSLTPDKSRSKDMAGAMKQINVKKLLLPNLPYVFIALFATKLGQAARLAPGADFSQKSLHIMEGFAAAFQSALPSFHPIDLCVGVAAALLIRLAVYVKGKNARKFRKNIEYGSARWGNAEDIKPYVDPAFANNVILTQTERLTMNSRPKDPKTARN